MESVFASRKIKDYKVIKVGEGLEGVVTNTALFSDEVNSLLDAYLLHAVGKEQEAVFTLEDKSKLKIIIYPFEIDRENCSILKVVPCPDTPGVLNFIEVIFNRQQLKKGIGLGQLTMKDEYDFNKTEMAKMYLKNKAKRGN